MPPRGSAGMPAAGFAPVMVGPLTGGPAEAPPTATHHAGWPGIRISGTRSNRLNSPVKLVSWLCR